MLFLGIVGVLVQGGVLAFATHAEVEEERSPADNVRVPVFVAGMVFLAAGVFRCADVVRLSTEEATYLPDGDDKSVIWVQQGGQTNGSNATHDEPRTPDDHVAEIEDSTVLVGISTTLLGFIAQFVALHSTVTGAIGRGDGHDDRSVFGAYSAAHEELYREPRRDRGTGWRKIFTGVLHGM